MQVVHSSCAPRLTSWIGRSISMDRVPCVITPPPREGEFAAAVKRRQGGDSECRLHGVCRVPTVRAGAACGVTSVRVCRLPLLLLLLLVPVSVRAAVRVEKLAATEVAN